MCRLHGECTSIVARLECAHMGGLGHADCRQVAHDETITILVSPQDDGTTPLSEQAADHSAMLPMRVNNDTWSDIRVRTFERDPHTVGAAGAFWMFYYPERARRAAIFEVAKCHEAWWTRKLPRREACV